MIALRDDNADSLDGFTVDEFQDSRISGLNGISPFGYAIQNGLHRVLEYMIEQGVDVNVSVSHTRVLTPLQVALASENDTAVLFLIENGATVDRGLFISVFNALIKSPDSGGLRQILHTILELPDMEIPQSISASGKSTLYEAIELGLDDETIQLLIHAGAMLAPTNLNVTQKPNNDVIHMVEGLQKRAVNEEEFGATLFVNEAYMDIPWLRAQIAYIRDLNNADKVTLAAYTYIGDTFLNAFIRGMFDTRKFLGAMELEPFTTAFHRYILMRRGIALESAQRDEFMEDLERNHVAYLEAYRDDLQRIIRAAPRPTRPVKVFRGIKHPEYMLTELKRSELFETSDFQSTSLSDIKGVEFARYRDPEAGDYRYGAVMEILLPAGTPCLFMEPLSKFEREVEILLPMGLHFRHGRTLAKRVDEMSRATRAFEIQVIEMRGVPVSETGV